MANAFANPNATERSADPTGAMERAEPVGRASSVKKAFVLNANRNVLAKNVAATVAGERVAHVLVVKTALAETATTRSAKARNAALTDAVEVVELVRTN